MESFKIDDSEINGPIVQGGMGIGIISTVVVDLTGENRRVFFIIKS